MPQDSNRNDTDKPKQHNNRQRQNYVDDFRWGFVPENDNSPRTGEPAKHRDSLSKKQPEARRPTPASEPASEKKKSEKPAPKTAVPGKRSAKSRKRSKPALPPLPVSQTNYEEDDDLKLPSYGRTPIPSDDELPVPKKIEKKKKVIRDGDTVPGSRERSSSRERNRDQEQDRKKTQAALPVQETLLVNVSPSGSPGVHPKREQLVWDPNLSAYVPLVETPSPAEPKPVKKSAKKPEKDSDTVAGSRKSDAGSRRSNKQKDDARKGDSRQDDARKEDARKDDIRKADSRKEAPRKDEPQKDEPRKESPRTAASGTPKKKAPRRSQTSKYIEPHHPDPSDVEAEVSGFAELGVSETMLEALKIVRYLAPTPIQAGVFQKVQAGVDLMGQAQTGTGKTAAFSMPIIEGVELCPPGNNPVALILVPTRELAVQVRDEAVRLAYGRDLRIAACYGGKPLAKQIERLRSGIDILVGTPGRILDLMKRRALSLESIRWVVLDEADRMLDIGFRPDIEKILRQTPDDRQTLLFSATLPQPVVRLAEKYMKSPEVLDFSNKSVAVDTIEQFYVTVDPERKFDALVYLLKEQEPRQAIIFTRTKRGADRLARLLSNRFDNLAAIHGDLAQSERDNVMSKVRSGSLRYLVATDVVGRGIDVSGISHIINYDVPKFCDDYVHRVGRTGRMGREGVAYTFVTVQEGSELTRIEMRIDKLLKRAELRGFESFTKPHDPEATLEDETPPEPPKPVFGKPVRKVRRAL